MYNVSDAFIHTCTALSRDTCGSQVARSDVLLTGIGLGNEVGEANYHRMHPTHQKKQTPHDQTTVASSGRTKTQPPVNMTRVHHGVRVSCVLGRTPTRPNTHPLQYTDKRPLLPPRHNNLWLRVLHCNSRLPVALRAVNVRDECTLLIVWYAWETGHAALHIASLAPPGRSRQVIGLQQRAH